VKNSDKLSKENSPEQVFQILEDRIYEYNVKQTNLANGLLFAYTIRDNEAVIVAGIAGWTWAGVCEITQFWVDEKRRGQGLGKALLEASEMEARDKGCRKILIKTYSFQAPHFYEKNGYKIAHTLNDFPPSYTYYTLTKELEY